MKSNNDRVVLANTIRAIREQRRKTRRWRPEQGEQFWAGAAWAALLLRRTERRSLRNTEERIAELTAHRACGNQEHDPQNGKLAGYCVVCQVPWPCAISQHKMKGRVGK